MPDFIRFYGFFRWYFYRGECLIVASPEIHQMAFWICDMALRPWTKSAETPRFRLWIKQATHIFIMKTKNNTHTKSTLAALAGLALAAGSAHAATPITILNGDFAADNGGDWTVVPSWNEGANSWTYTPAGNQLLYLNTGGKVDQDLSHNWTSSDTFTLSLTGQDPSG